MSPEVGTDLTWERVQQARGGATRRADFEPRHADQEASMVRRVRA
jgi:hypothetical protein